MMQAFRSNVRKMMRSVNPQENRQLLSELSKLDRAATSDMKAVMTPDTPVGWG
jgi:hypothetical protein